MNKKKFNVMHLFQYEFSRLWQNVVTLFYIHYTICDWSTKPVLSRWGIFVAIAKNTLCIIWVKIIEFYFMPKSLGH